MYSSYECLINLDKGRIKSVGVKENYISVYGDTVIKKLDEECYINLKRYEEKLHKFKLRIVMIFSAFILFKLNTEIKVEKYSFEDLYSWEYGISIICAIILHYCLSYGIRYHIYRTIKGFYEKGLKKEQASIAQKTNCIILGIKCLVKFLVFLKGLVINCVKKLIFPDWQAAKIFKSQIHKFTIENIQKEHRINGRKIKNDCKSKGDEDKKNPSILEGNEKSSSLINATDGLKNQCDKHYVDKYGLCIQCNDSIRFMTKFHVKFSNWYNFLISIILALTIICSITYSNYIFQKEIVLGLSLLLLLRLFSRTVEIAKAFYDDVVQVGARIFSGGSEKVYLHAWKNSYIRKPLRISLAIHSLFELMLMFVCAYMLTVAVFGNQVGFEDKNANNRLVETVEVNSNVININMSKESASSKVKDYIIEGKVYEFFLYATSICFFNISYVNYGFIVWNILHVWQVAMSMILIILCIAAYLGNDDDMYTRESKFFARTLRKIPLKNNR